MELSRLIDEGWQRRDIAEQAFGSRTTKINILSEFINGRKKLLDVDHGFELLVFLLKNHSQEFPELAEAIGIANSPALESEAKIAELQKTVASLRESVASVQQELDTKDYLLQKTATQLRAMEKNQEAAVSKDHMIEPPNDDDFDKLEEEALNELMDTFDDSNGKKKTRRKGR